MEKLISDQYVNATYCLNPESQTVDLKPLKLEDVVGIMMLFAAGLLSWNSGVKIFSLVFKPVSQGISTVLSQYK